MVGVTVCDQQEGNAVAGACFLSRGSLCGKLAALS